MANPSIKKNEIKIKQIRLSTDGRTGGVLFLYRYANDVRATNNIVSPRRSLAETLYHNTLCA